ncbi:MAG: hypothetical protein MK033_12555 [Candidatus Caenarcaniphilales bacterium]|nr:hypothetical protein [Candidatus Caenarcaniphilales bacterium]
MENPLAKQLIEEINKLGELNKETLLEKTNEYFKELEPYLNNFYTNFSKIKDLDLIEFIKEFNILSSGINPHLPDGKIFRSCDLVK